MKKEKNSKFPFELNQTQVKELYNCVESDCKWEGFLEELFVEFIEKDKVYLHEKHYIEARKDCNEKQHKVLDSIFCKFYEYGIGDYVITRNYCHKYDGKILKITSISDNTYAYFENNNINDNFDIGFIQRKATEQEIQQYEWEKNFPEKTPCLVRNHNDQPWTLAFSTSIFKKFNTQKDILYYSYYQKLDINNLPKD